MLLRAGLALLYCCTASLLADGSSFAGPAACRPCHSKKYQQQINSHHANALRRAEGTNLTELLSSQPLRERSGVTFRYEPVQGGVRAFADQGNRSASALIEWVFGAGAQAITPVGVRNGHFIEHRISFFREPGAPRRTLGHSGNPSKDPESALGIVQDRDTSFRCFHCHATGVKPGPDLSAVIPGVTCERCHGAGAEHAAGKASLRAANSRTEVMELCGSCHRLPQGVSAAPEVHDEMSIRFAPVGLMASACYRESKSLSCITCHDPHEDASKQTSFYDGKCLGCHEGGTLCRAGKSSGCTGCHMQQRYPAEYLRFTDHRIRVYREK